MDIVPIKKQNLETVLEIYCELSKQKEAEQTKDNLVNFDGENIILVIIFLIFLLFNMYKTITSKKRRITRVSSNIGD